MNIKISKLKSYKLQATSYSRAFTLIELIVTISIMVLLFVIAMPAFKNYSYVNQLDSSADTLDSAIVETQTLALAPPVDKNKDFDSYKIEFDQKGAIIYAGKFSGDDLIKTGVNGQVEIKKFNLSSGVTISNILANKNRIIYSISDQGRINYPVGAPLELVLTHNKTDKTESVTVNLITGQVTVK